ncbi:DUF397 domain-containing protein [Nocardiopsis mangrovi]|uniref:DUF397 domain-containing protein n=1 Tax=Nocardiopsis mangrovi TaxID=1179818 RepID=A0ABV9E055_9ACTN
MCRMDEWDFRTSSHSLSENCVAIARLGHGRGACGRTGRPRGAGVAVRDSAYPGAGCVEVPEREWAAFLRAVKRRAL